MSSPKVSLNTYCAHVLVAKLHATMLLTAASERDLANYSDY